MDSDYEHLLKDSAMNHVPASLTTPIWSSETKTKEPILRREGEGMSEITHDGMGNKLPSYTEWFAGARDIEAENRELREQITAYQIAKDNLELRLAKELLFNDDANLEANSLFKRKAFNWQVY